MASHTTQRSHAAALSTTCDGSRILVVFPTPAVRPREHCCIRQHWKMRHLLLRSWPWRTDLFMDSHCLHAWLPRSTRLNGKRAERNIRVSWHWRQASSEICAQLNGTHRTRWSPLHRSFPVASPRTSDSIRARFLFMSVVDSSVNKARNRSNRSKACFNLMDRLNSDLNLRQTPTFHFPIWSLWSPCLLSRASFELRIAATSETVSAAHWKTVFQLYLIHSSKISVTTKLAYSLPIDKYQIYRVRPHAIYDLHALQLPILHVIRIGAQPPEYSARGRGRYYEYHWKVS